MNKDLGTVVTALVTDKNEQAYFVQKSGVTYRLAKTEVEGELDLGDTVEGFAYESMKKELSFTTNIPKSQVDRKSTRLNSSHL